MKPNLIDDNELEEIVSSSETRGYNNAIKDVINLLNKKITEKQNIIQLMKK